MAENTYDPKKLTSLECEKEVVMRIIEEYTEKMESAVSGILEGSTAVVELEEGQTLDDIDFSRYEEGTVVLVVGGEEDEA